MRSSLALAATLTASIVLPATAVASTVGFEDGTVVFRSGSRTSDMTLSQPDFGTLAFTDARQTLSAGAGCTPGAPVLCANPDLAPQLIRLGGGNDRVRAFSFSSLTVTASGGNDDIDANGNATDVSAGLGDDKVVVGSNGLAVVAAGDGDDAVRTTTGMSSQLDGQGGKDLLVATRPFVNTVTGGGGNDDIFVMAGDGSVKGGDGDDALILRGDGFFGSYSVDGGTGNDAILGSTGNDTIHGAGGNDVIDASGDAADFGSVDSIDCGGGLDTVYADAEDTVAANCERVLSGPAARPAAVTRALTHLAHEFPEVTAPEL
jgi:hypothetical protein